MAGFTRSSTFAEEIKARHPQADAAFTSGVTSVFSQWTALELAVVHGWGGTDSKKKADALLDDVLGLGWLGLEFGVTIRVRDKI